MKGPRMLPPSCPKTSEITERRDQKRSRTRAQGFNVVASGDLAYVTNSKRMVQHPEAAAQDRTRRDPTRVYTRWLSGRQSWRRGRMLRPWMLKNQLMWPINIIDRPRFGNSQRDARGLKFGRKSGAVAGATRVWSELRSELNEFKKERN